MVIVIRLQLTKLSTVEDVQHALQTAIGVEFGTLPPYLYALYSIKPGTNQHAQDLIRSVALEEMVHVCLACNMLNAIGGNPLIHPQTYPNPLPGDIGPDGKRLILNLIPFSREAMDQGMKIEQPEDPPDFPILKKSLIAGPKAVSIGEFYMAVDDALKQLPTSVWTPGRNQITDDQFFAGQIYPINKYDDAHRAIHDIVTEGEGSKQGTDYNPLDYQGELAHYFRFGEVFHNKVLTRTAEKPGYAWGPEPLGVDWDVAYPAIWNPGTRDFSHEPPAAQQAQLLCNQSFTNMVNALQKAVQGQASALGDAVRFMFDLRMAAMAAFKVPLADGKNVAGPAFLYLSSSNGGTQ
jgi:Ferritin-like